MVFYSSNYIKLIRAATNKHKNANKNIQQPHFCTIYMNSKLNEIIKNLAVRN